MLYETGHARVYLEGVETEVEGGGTVFIPAGTFTILGETEVPTGDPPTPMTRRRRRH